MSARTPTSLVALGLLIATAAAHAAVLRPVDAPLIATYFPIGWRPDSAPTHHRRLDLREGVGGDIRARARCKAGRSRQVGGRRRSRETGQPTKQRRVRPSTSHPAGSPLTPSRARARRAMAPGGCRHGLVRREM